MKNIIINNKYKIIILIIVLARLFITSSLIPEIRVGMVYDDVLMKNMAESIKNGNYLGTYSSLTLVKGIAFPFFVALLSILKIPYLMGIDIFYLLACGFFVNSLRNYKYGKKSLLILLLFLAFNPIMFSYDVYILFYRNGFNICLILFFLGSLINYYRKPNITNAILTGLFYFLLSITREDYFFLLPALIFVIFFVKNNYLRILPILTFFVLNILLMTVNYISYGGFIKSELSSSEFKDAYVNLSRVTTLEGEQLGFREKLELASKHSETFNIIFEELNKENGILNSEGFQKNYTFWEIRRIADKLGYFDEFEESSEFFGKINKELAIAEENNKIKLEKRIPIVVVSGVNNNFIKEMPPTMYKMLKHSIGYKDIKFLNGHSKVNETSKEFYNLTNYDLSNEDKYGVQNSLITFINILDVYRIFNYFIVFIGFGSFIYLIYNKRDIIVELIILGSSFVLLSGIAYSDVTSMNAFRFYYLAPLYLMLSIFSLLSVMKLYNYFKRRYSDETISTNTML